MKIENGKLCVKYLDLLNVLILLAIPFVLTGFILVGLEIYSPFIPRTVTFLTFMASMWLVFLLVLRKKVSLRDKDM